MVRNDSTPDKKKFLGITPHDTRIPDNQYVLYYNQRILAKDVPVYSQDSSILFNHYSSCKWAEKKSNQLHEQLGIIVYIVTFKVLYQQDYRIINYAG